MLLLLLLPQRPRHAEELVDELLVPLRRRVLLDVIQKTAPTQDHGPTKGVVKKTSTAHTHVLLPSLTPSAGWLPAYLIHSLALAVSRKAFKMLLMWWSTTVLPRSPIILDPACAAAAQTSKA